MKHISRNNFAIALAVVLLAGCSSTGVRAPQSIEESIYVAAVYGKSLTATVNEAYLAAAITKAQQLQALDALQKSKDGLQVALDAYRAGNFASAEDRLGQVEAALRTVALIVARYGAEQ